MTMSTSDWHVIGVDPAPKKNAVTYDGCNWVSVEPVKLRKHLEGQMAANARTLIAWDSPLSFAKDNFSDRKVDWVVRRWVGQQNDAHRLVAEAVNAQPFSRVSHWAISCGSLGFPFGEKPRGIRLAQLNEPLDQGCLVIEVHPAVAIAAFWIDKKINTPLPVYKGKSSGEAAECSRIAGELGFPPEAGKNDDYLDAFVAYRLGRMFLERRARWLGNPDEGGYVMPCGRSTEELCRMYAQTSVVGRKKTFQLKNSDIGIDTCSQSRP